jgi:sugar lactone lactonase YvrE
MEITRIGDITTGWGESLLWDEARQRLYFVDCAARTLHWLDDGGDEVHTLSAPSMPTGIVATTDGRVLAALDDGLHVVDPDSGEWNLVSPYPDEIGGRCNDMCADAEGNIVTGKLNLGPASGSAWWFSARHGWRMLDPDIANTNGPNAGVIDGVMTLIVGDTSAHYYAYPYDPTTGSVGERQVFGDMTDLDGGPDGAALDSDGGLWCALFGGGRLVRFAHGRLDREVAMPLPNPTDVAFAGPGLDRLYVTFVDGGLMALDRLGAVGRIEPRCSL